ncbi:FecR domain-containing protein [Pseudomonas sp. LP_7_YM]|uniref:FecR domain-containing protein n=1 Tax=Pseudomonas sp. LP_7_YM TaxID=2485137 RepID=UPI00105E3408|nr:FecR family protein [Pseudomonas sp. LP_7_YM]TDV59137.1 FecR family protein [Pseudomonas sp. LP_7_YM]
MNQASLIHSPQPSPAVVRQAIEWMIRLNDHTVSPPLRQRCDQWRAAHPDHECAWQWVQRLDTDLHSQFEALPASGAAINALQATAQRLGRRQALKLLSGLVVAGAGAYLARDLTPWQQWTADFSTQVGQRSGVALADGTRLLLNTDSAVDQHLSAKQRLIALSKGEILVTCGADTGSTTPRPLLISCQHGRVEGLTGRFVVRQDEHRTRLSVMEGRVLIHSLGSSPQTVLAGQSYSLNGQRAELLPALDMDPGAWADGLLVTRDMRLDDFIAEVARYRRGYVACEQDIGQLRLSGVFRLEDTDKLLAILAQTLPVRLKYRTRWWVTLQRSA